MKIVWFISLGAGLLLLLTGFFMTAGFLAGCLSPDGILAQKTIQNIQLLMLLVACTGIAAAVFGTLNLICPSKVYRFLYSVSHSWERFKASRCGQRTKSTFKSSASVASSLNYVRLNYIKILQLLILLALPSIYIYYMTQYFWELPAPSDPLMYLGPTIRHSLGGFSLFDRIVVVNGLCLASAIFSPIYIAGVYYIGVVNSLIVLIGIFWCYIKKGFFAGLFAGILLISSRLLLGCATYIYADQTVALFALLAFIFFFSKYRNKLFDPMILAGIFTALTCFSKIVGIAIFVPFIVSIALEKKWGELKKLLIGLILGILVVFFITYLLFGWDSLKGSFLATVHRYWTSWNVVVLPGSPISYFSLLAREYYLPLFFSIVILIGAYREKVTRNLYFAAIGFVMFLTLAVSFTKSATAAENYLYPAVVFSSLGLAMYLGSLLKEKSTQLSTRFSFIFRDKVKLIYALICLFSVFFALQIGIDHYWAFTHPKEANIVRMAYPVIPLIIVGGLLLIEYSKSRIAILLFMILISLWSPAYNGAFAYASASFARQEAGFFYKAAPVLNDVPAKEFSIYVESWNKTKYTGHPDRILWVYHSFFDENKKPFFIRHEKDIPTAKGNQILTDNPEEVRHCFPYAREIKTVPWEGEMLTVLEISQEGNKEGKQNR